MAIVSQNASLSRWNPQYSNLDIDGTPDRYDTQGQLAALGDNVSNINPDGLPTPYDTQGQLASLGDNVSNLNPDGSPDRYNTQGRLAELGDNVSNINPDGLPTPYDTQGQLAALGDNVSNLNPDGSPSRYNTQGILGSLGDNVSNINPDGLPTPYDTQGVLASLGDNISNLNLDGSPDRYNTQGVLASLGDNISNLNPDGTLSTYDTQGQLASLGDNISQLNPDGTFVTYDTQGVLASLGDNISQLNVDGTPSTYDTQGVLSSLGDNVSQLNPDGTFVTYDTQGILGSLGDNISQLNVDGTPSTYDTQGQLGSLPPGASNLDFDGPIPASADAFLNTHAQGFTIQAPVGVTQFLNDGQTSIYGYGPGPIQGTIGVDAFINDNAQGFVIQAPIGVTQFIDPGNSSIYGWSGNRNDAPEVNNFTLPGPSGLLSAFGFTKFGPGYSQFTYGGQTSIYGFWDVLPGPAWPASPNGGNNFFINTNANGFTIKNPVGISQFILNGQTSIYGLGGSTSDSGPSGANSTNFFTDTHAKGFTVRTPIGVTQFIDDGQTSKYGLGGRRTGTDFFNSTDVNGFTLRNGYLQSNFVNIEGNTYTPNPASVISTVTLGPHVPGTATMDNQLGQGSPRFRNTGFSTTNRYSVGNGLRLADNAMSLEKYAKERLKDSDTGPYVISERYGQNLKLRATAYNPTYMLHPLILRGIQNPDKLGPQTWGIDLSGDSTGLAAAVDGGFVRGGASTALARSIIDTARIAKFLASPRGIVWIATQFGLGKSNPRVEKNPLNTLPFNDTRSHSGIASLLSIPGTAFGLHFTRHGIPFANEAASYEQVHIGYKQTDPSGANTRLWKLKQELFGAGAYNSVPNSTEPLKIGGGGKKIRPSENPVIEELSGLGGPNSVYGIGSTTILRYANTIQALRVLQDKTEFGPISGINDKFNPIRPDINDRYGIYNQYAAFLNNNRTSQGTGQEDKSQNLGDTTDTSGQIFTDDGGKNIGLAWQLNNATETDPNYIPGSTGLKPDVGTAVMNPAASKGTNAAEKTKYSTLPYQELQNIAKNRTPKTNRFDDFREGLKSSAEKTFIGQADYNTDNIRDKYGFGKQGESIRNGQDKDVSNPYSIKDKNGTDKNQLKHAVDLLKSGQLSNPFALQKDPTFNGDKINAIDYISEATAKTNKLKGSNIYGDSNDFIKFYFSGLNSITTSPDYDDYIIFRATVKNISDAFTPSWNSIQVMGRPEGPGNYSTFERVLSFDFTAYASAREELVPMWRKLNYLSTYTMPVHGNTNKPGGPLFRITIGDMYKELPVYFTSFTMTVNEEATWDLGTTADGNAWSKQLPNVVDVNCSMRIIHDWRHQKGGRAFSLYNDNFDTAGTDGSWLWDTNIPK